MTTDHSNQIQSLTALTKLLGIGFVVSLFSQIFFGRGLDLDGVHILYELVFVKSFTFYETSRMTTHFFQQLPTWFFINFIPINSIETLIQVFSFGLIWVHAFSLVGCYLILPKDKKHMLFFPLFGFFTGPLVALGISISASLVVCSYIWLVAFMIYYSPLSYKSHFFLLFITTLPLILSQEKLFYMSWFLIYLLLQRRKNFPYKWLQYYFTLFLIVCSVSSLFFIISPVKSELPNRSEFFNSLFTLDFFFKSKEGSLDSIYYPALASFLLIIFPFLSFFKQKKEFIYPIMIILILFLSLCSAILPFYKQEPFFKLSTEEEVRAFVSCISHPLSILLWWLFEQKTFKIKKSFFITCVVSSLFLLIYRAGSDYKFYQFQKQFSAVLEHSEGIIKWEDITLKEGFKQKTDPLLFELFESSWKRPSASLFYPRKNKVKTIVLTNIAFEGCYESPPYGMCQNKPLLKNNKFFHFDILKRHDDLKQLNTR